MNIQTHLLHPPLDINGPMNLQKKDLELLIFMGSLEMMRFIESK